MLGITEFQKHQAAAVGKVGFVGSRDKDKDMFGDSLLLYLDPRGAKKGGISSSWLCCDSIREEPGMLGQWILYLTYTV